MNTTLKVHIVPFSTDNYAYIIQDSRSKECVVVDPGEAEPVQAYLDQHKLSLNQIWVTHFHKDHIGGLAELKEKNMCVVYGPTEEADKIQLLDEEVGDLDLFKFHKHSVKVLELPGHTMGHIGYWLFNDNIFFCGDTLFSLGCGYLFEGTHLNMWNSLCKIRSLPADTQIYCGHEYSQDNAKFALHLDPENEELKNYAQEIDALREKNHPTMPMLLQREMYTNPFLRADLPYWKERLHMPDATDVQIFQEIRDKKNHFKA